MDKTTWFKQVERLPLPTRTQPGSFSWTLAADWLSFTRQSALMRQAEVQMIMPQLRTGPAPGTIQAVQCQNARLIQFNLGQILTGLTALQGRLADFNNAFVEDSQRIVLRIEERIEVGAGLRRTPGRTASRAENAALSALNVYLQAYMMFLRLTQEALGQIVSLAGRLPGGIRNIPIPTRP